MQFYFSHFQCENHPKISKIFILNISIFAQKFENCQKYYLEMRFFLSIFQQRIPRGYIAVQSLEVA